VSARICLLWLQSCLLLGFGFGAGPACLGEAAEEESLPAIPSDPLQPPVTFSLPEYQPAYWNDGTTDRQYCHLAGTIASPTRQDNNNCYNYALNVDATLHGDSSFAQPGMGTGVLYRSSDPASLERAAIADGLEYVGPTYPDPVAGKAVVVLLVARDYGFHWSRQDRDGTWSHKNGREAATNLDHAGLRITDPAKADWGRYVFYGYFLVDAGPDQGLGQEAIFGETFPTNVCQ